MIGGILKTFPWGKVEDPLLGEGGPAEPGRVWGGTKSDLVPPLFRRCGGTFPQGQCHQLKVSISKCQKSAANISENAN